MVHHGIPGFGDRSARDCYEGQESQPRQLSAPVTGSEETDRQLPRALTLRYFKASNSAAVQGWVRLAVAARTSFTCSGVISDALLPHALRM